MRDALRKVDYGEVVDLQPGAEAPRVLIVCDHASNRIPQQLGTLGLDPVALQSHIAWDPGALNVARSMSGALGAPLIWSGVSRLVYDCNRPPEAASSIPVRSEATDVPGNSDLSPTCRSERVRQIYHPFHRAIANQIEGARETLELLLTVHSFTPVFHGRTRDVELGLIHGTDARFAKAMMAARSSLLTYDTRLNEPYTMADGVAHTLDRHGPGNGLHSVMIEIRSDLIDSLEAQNDMAQRLASWVQDILRGLPV